MHVCQTINIQYVYICQCMYVCMLTGLLPRGIRNAHKHGTTPVDVFESASERRGADGIDARA